MGAFMLGRKVFFWLKMPFNPKNTQNFLRDWYLFGKRQLFLWTTFSGRGQNMVSIKKWTLFFRPEISFLAQRSDFCHTTPILINSPFVAHGLFIPTLISIFRLCIPELCKKKRLTRQKVFPSDITGMTSNSISANDEIGRLLGDVCEDELNTTFDFDCRWGLKMEGFQLVLESFSFAQSQILDSKERSYQKRKRAARGRQREHEC